MKYQSQHPNLRRRSNAKGLKIRLIVALIILGFSIISYIGGTQVNKITGEKQRVSMSQQEEISLGLSALPSISQKYGGLSKDPAAVRNVKNMGERLQNALRQKLAEQEIKNPYPFNFHLLADRKTINAFALPGGQIFITEGLYKQFTSPGQLAGVLGHEMGHVLERHAAQRISKEQVTQGIVQATGVASDINLAQMASAFGHMINLSYGRQDELESDRWGVELMVDAGFNPQHMLEVMDILNRGSVAGTPPEFLSTHPKPINRKQYLTEIIREKFPNGVPMGLR